MSQNKKWIPFLWILNDENNKVDILHSQEEKDIAYTEYFSLALHNLLFDDSTPQPPTPWLKLGSALAHRLQDDHFTFAFSQYICQIDLSSFNTSTHLTIGTPHLNLRVFFYPFTIL